MQPDGLQQPHVHAVVNQRGESVTAQNLPQGSLVAVFTNTDGSTGVIPISPSPSPTLIPLGVRAASTTPVVRPATQSPSSAGGPIQSLFGSDFSTTAHNVSFEGSDSRTPNHSIGARNELFVKSTSSIDSGATSDTICRHHMEGKCNRRKCRFRHDASGMTDSLMNSSSIRGIPATNSPSHNGNGSTQSPMASISSLGGVFGPGGRM